MIIDATERFARTPRGAALIGAWAFLEAILLPVVPDVGLLLLTLAAPRRWLALFLTLIAGSLLGTALLWLVFTANADAAHGLVMAVPGVRNSMLDDASAAFAVGNPMPFAVLGSGTPLKVLSLAWLEAGGGAAALPLWVIVNRLARIGPALLVSVVVGMLAPGWLRRHDRLTLALYAAIWLGVYALYLS